MKKKKKASPCALIQHALLRKGFAPWKGRCSSKEVSIFKKKDFYEVKLNMVVHIAKRSR